MINFDEIKQQLSVNNVIGHYLKGDRNLSGQHSYFSPWKKERTPSLVATDAKGIWKDFSSGKGGDIFAFIKEYKGYNFFEVLKELQETFGIEIDLGNDYNKEEGIKQKKIYEIHDLCNAFMVELLHKDTNQSVLYYLQEKRKLSLETIERFGISFSEGRLVETFIGKLLRKPEYSDITKKDLSFFNDDGNFIFTDRIMYPVRTMFGKIVAFSGGRIHEDQNPKYIHTNNNYIYKKAYNLLNIDKVHFNQKDIYICEGNIDSIQLYNYGGEKSIALLGTAVSDIQMRSFINKVDSVTLLLDNDSAGTRALYEIAERAYSYGKFVYVFNMGSYKDIDEYLLGNPELKGFIDNHIDENKKELLTEVLLPSFGKNQENLSVESRKDILDKIKTLYLSIPTYLETFRLSYTMALKAIDLEFAENKLSIYQESGYPELTEQEKLSLTGFELQEYEKDRDNYIKTKDKFDSGIEDFKNDQEIENTLQEVATYISFKYPELYDLIKRKKIADSMELNSAKVLPTNEIDKIPVLDKLIEEKKYDMIYKKISKK